MRVRETVWRGDRGEGTIFYFVDAESGKKVSPNLYLFYRAGGKEHTVSTLTDDVEAAKRDLRRFTRNRENAREGKEPLIVPRTERLTVGDLLDANVVRAEERRLATSRTTRYRSATLKRVLGSVRAIEFRPGHAREYAARRLAEKVKPATVHRELEVLDGAFRCAVEEGTLRFRPHVPKPTVDNVSEREFPKERLGELLAALRKRDEVVADLVEFISLTARRPEGVRRLTWSLFDAATWTLRIPAEKRGNPVLLGLDGTLRAVVERRLAARHLGCDLIFHRGGRRMWSDHDRDLFAAACADLELPYGREDGFTIYSVKSTAVGLAHEAGLSESEIMDRSGHRTASMMRRYLKQHPDRAHAASRKLEAHLAESRKRETEGTIAFPRQSATP